VPSISLAPDSISYPTFRAGFLRYSNRVTPSLAMNGRGMRSMSMAT
jgi:hypothetical protein